MIKRCDPLISNGSAVLIKAGGAGARHGSATLNALQHDTPCEPLQNVHC
jgi:hypothetical protein